VETNRDTRYTAAAECLKEGKVIKIDGDRLMRVFEKHHLEGMLVIKRLTGIFDTRLVNAYEEATGP
jgi:hypothetical protein